MVDDGAVPKIYLTVCFSVMYKYRVKLCIHYLRFTHEFRGEFRSLFDAAHTHNTKFWHGQSIFPTHVSWLVKFSWNIAAHSLNIDWLVCSWFVWAVNRSYIFQELSGKNTRLVLSKTLLQRNVSSTERREYPLKVKRIPSICCIQKGNQSLHVILQFLSNLETTARLK